MQRSALEPGYITLEGIEGIEENAGREPGQELPGRVNN